MLSLFLRCLNKQSAKLAFVKLRRFMSKSHALDEHRHLAGVIFRRHSHPPTFATCLFQYDLTHVQACRALCHQLTLHLRQEYSSLDRPEPSGLLKPELTLLREDFWAKWSGRVSETVVVGERPRGHRGRLIKFSVFIEASLLLYCLNSQALQQITFPSTYSSKRQQP